jgi:hypothetical protein
MSARTAVVVGVLWLASLVAAVATAREHVREAQALEPKIEVQVGPAQEPRILSGGDIGFRLDRWQGNAPTGTLVIRLNGKWVEPTTSKGPVLITR